MADRASTLLEAARAALPERRAQLDALVAMIALHRHDRTRVHEVGRALEEIASGKLYRARGHVRFVDLLTELGLSRATAYKWRVIARELDPGTAARLGREDAYRTARPAKKKRAKRAPSREGEAEVSAMLARLRKRGVRGARAQIVTRSGQTIVRLELPVRACERIG